MSRAINRRNMVKGAAAVAALVPAASLPAIASAESIIALCADALRLGHAWNAACSTYATATDAAMIAGLPTQAPDSGDDERSGCRRAWEEADARFSITAALAASDAAGTRAYAAIDAVEAATIASAAGAFAVFALGHYLIEDGDDERARPLFDKARAYVDRAGILGADFPAARQIMTSPEGGDA